MKSKLEFVKVANEPPKGFWEVVGFEPYVYCGVNIKSATFAAQESAETFATERGGEVRHRNADFILDK